MRDKRPVDELSIEELERILTMRKREERQKRLEKLRRDGRVLDAPDADQQPVRRTPAAAPVSQTPPPPAPAPAPVANGSLTSAAPDRPLYVVPAPVVGAGAATSVPAPAVRPVSAVAFEDDDPYDVRPVAEGGRAARRFMNRVLLVVEAVAIIGLVVIGVNLWQAVGKLETETASAAALADEQRRAGIPTIAPTPVLTLQTVVLPGGHTFTDSGVPQFNYSEIPSHLLPLVQDQIVAPAPRRPPPTDETALRLIVPKLDIDQSIVQGVDWEALRSGVGQVPNNATPADEVGNVVLAAHNDIYGEIFRYIDQLENGDQFQIQTRSRIYTYTVTGNEIVAPTDVYVMAARGEATVTLISCYPYQVNDKRIVVYARQTG